MPRRFRLRISRVIPSFHSCRSKEDAAAAGTPASPILLSTVNPTARRRLPAEGDASAYLWREEAKWHVVARAEPAPRLKIDADDSHGELFPPLQLQRRPRKPPSKKQKMKARSKLLRPGRASTSSADTDWFSSEDDGDEEEEYEEDYDYEETETRVSSSRNLLTSHSSSSSEFNPKLKPIHESPDHSAAEGRRRSSSSVASALLRRLFLGHEGKMAESFAVVKRSEDPYEDFRRSMLEMVVEKGMYGEEELEELLRCFLSLNSHRHHAAIVRAFSDVWAAVFAHSSRSSCVSVAATPPGLTPS